jgi:hypothetical protein
VSDDQVRTAPGRHGRTDHTQMNQIPHGCASSEIEL